MRRLTEEAGPATRRSGSVRPATVAWWAVAALLLAVAVWGVLAVNPAPLVDTMVEPRTLDVTDYGATGDGVTDDAPAFQAALDEARPGWTVVAPPATYLIGSTLEVGSAVTLEGRGATLHMPDQSVTSGLLDVDGTSGVAIVGLTLRADAPESGVIGIAGVVEGADHLSVRDLRTENLEYGMKLGSSGSSAGLSVRNWTARGDSQSLYLGNVTGGVLTGLDLECAAESGANNHNVYLEKGNADLTFDTLRLAGGGGYSLHLYMDSTADRDRGRRITFRNVHLDGPTQGVVVERYDGVTFTDLTGSVADGFAFFVMYDTTDVTVEGFDVAGAPHAFLADDRDGPVSGVTLRNGIYHQPNLLGDEAAITGLVLENVVAASSPPTSAARGQADADVESVVADLGSDGLWTFHVTVAHPERGPGFVVRR